MTGEVVSKDAIYGMYKWRIPFLQLWKSSISLRLYSTFPYLAMQKASRIDFQSYESSDKVFAEKNLMPLFQKAILKHSNCYVSNACSIYIEIKVQNSSVSFSSSTNVIDRHPSLWRKPNFHMSLVLVIYLMSGWLLLVVWKLALMPPTSTSLNLKRFALESQRRFEWKSIWKSHIYPELETVLQFCSSHSSWMYKRWFQ